MIRNAISIVGNDGYNQEEQRASMASVLSCQYDMDIVQSVLERREMDVYIFNKPEQFSIIPLLEDYIPDFRHWGYYLKLKYWKG